MPKKRERLTSRQVAEIQAASGCAPNTIRRWERGDAIREVTRERIEAAVEKRALVEEEEIT
jgi:hypothetical protein